MKIRVKNMLVFPQLKSLEDFFGEKTVYVSPDAFVVSEDGEVFLNMNTSYVESYGLINDHTVTIEIKGDEWIIDFKNYQKIFSISSSRTIETLQELHSDIFKMTDENSFKTIHNASEFFKSMDIATLCALFVEHINENTFSPTTLLKDAIEKQSFRCEKNALISLSESFSKTLESYLAYDPSKDPNQTEDMIEENNDEVLEWQCKELQEVILILSNALPKDKKDLALILEKEKEKENNLQTEREKTSKRIQIQARLRSIEEEILKNMQEQKYENLAVIKTEKEKLEADLEALE